MMRTIPIIFLNLLLGLYSCHSKRTKRKLSSDDSQVTSKCGASLVGEALPALSTSELRNLDIDLTLEKENFDKLSSCSLDWNLSEAMPVILWRVCTPGSTDCTAWCSSINGDLDPLEIPSSVEKDTKLTVEAHKCIAKNRKEGSLQTYQKIEDRNENFYYCEKTKVRKSCDLSFQQMSQKEITQQKTWINGLIDLKCKGIPSATKKTAQKACSFYRSTACPKSANEDILTATDSPTQKICKLAASLCKADPALLQQSVLLGGDPERLTQEESPEASLVSEDNPCQAMQAQNFRKKRTATPRKKSSGTAAGVDKTTSVGRATDVGKATSASTDSSTDSSKTESAFLECQGLTGDDKKDCEAYFEGPAQQYEKEQKNDGKSIGLTVVAALGATYTLFRAYKNIKTLRQAKQEIELSQLKSEIRDALILDDTNLEDIKALHKKYIKTYAARTGISADKMQALMDLDDPPKKPEAEAEAEAEGKNNKIIEKTVDDFIKKYGLNSEEGSTLDDKKRKKIFALAMQFELDKKAPGLKIMRDLAQEAGFLRKFGTSEEELNSRFTAIMNQKGNTKTKAIDARKNEIKVILNNKEGEAPTEPKEAKKVYSSKDQPDSMYNKIYKIGREDSESKILGLDLETEGTKKSAKIPDRGAGGKYEIFSNKGPKKVHAAIAKQGLSSAFSISLTALLGYFSFKSLGKQATLLVGSTEQKVLRASPAAVDFLYGLESTLKEQELRRANLDKKRFEPSAP